MADESAEQGPRAVKKTTKKQVGGRRKGRRGTVYTNVPGENEAGIAALTYIPDVPELVRSGDADRGEAAQVFMEKAGSDREAQRELDFRLTREDIAVTMRDDLDQLIAGRYPAQKQFKLESVVAQRSGDAWLLRFEAPGRLFRRARQLAEQLARPGQSNKQRTKNFWSSVHKAGMLYWVEEELLLRYRLVCISQGNKPLFVFKLTSEQPEQLKGPTGSKVLFEVVATPVSKDGAGWARNAPLARDEGVQSSLMLVQLTQAAFCESMLQKLHKLLKTPFDDLLRPRQDDCGDTSELEEEDGKSWPGLAVKSQPQELKEVVDSLDSLPDDADLSSLFGVTVSLAGGQEPLLLHKSQRQAVQQCLRQRVSLIQGPPGTGKTFIAALLCALMVKLNRTVMVVCKTNHALDQMLELAEDFGVPHSRLARLGRNPKTSQRARRMWRSKTFFDRAGKSDEAFIVGCTTTGAAIPAHEAKLSLLEPAVMLLEEAGEVTEPQLQAAIHASVKRLIFIGDHEQLPPLVHAPGLRSASGNGYHLDVSTLQRLICEHFPYTQLLVQHRQRPELADIIRATTYSELIDATSTKERSPKFAPGMARTVGAFVNHNWPEERRRRSWRNEGEAGIVLKIVQHCVAQVDYNIAVITPYIAQRDLLHDVLSNAGVPTAAVETEEAGDQVATVRNRGRGAAPSPQDSERLVRVATVDSFQGEQARLVIFSTARSNGRGGIGFLKLPQRVNVALSRARDGLIVVGNRRTLTARSFAGSGGNVWHTFLEKAEKSSGWTVSDALHVSCSRHPHAPEGCLLFDSPPSSSPSSSSSPSASASWVCAACVR